TCVSRTANAAMELVFHLAPFPENRFLKPPNVFARQSDRFQRTQLSHDRHWPFQETESTEAGELPAQYCVQYHYSFPLAYAREGLAWLESVDSSSCCPGLSFGLFPD